MRLTDYKEKSSFKGKRRPNTKLRYFSVGFASGVIFVCGLILTDVLVSDLTNMRDQVKEFTLPKSSLAEGISKIFGPHNLPPVEFDFYEQDAIPEGDMPAIRGTAIFQAGSLKHEEDAESVRAMLALSGVDSKVEKVMVDGINLRYRVMVGPLSGDESIINTRIKILDAGIVPLLLRKDSTFDSKVD